MASSIISGLVAQGYDPAHITASDPNEEQLARLAKETGVNSSADNNEACAGADLILLAVKPQIMKSVVKSLVLSGDTGPLIISIAAGITVGNLIDWFGRDLPVVRSMPNTPALVGRGATGLYANASVSAVHKELTDCVFSAVGTASWFEHESDLDKVVALSGSGPAYFFMFMEAMETAAKNMGLDPESARQLTLQTALGSSELAIRSDENLADLRRRVTSPGGTTERAIQCFTEGGLLELVADAMAAAQERSLELAANSAMNKK